jgi:hypothetical protein
MALGEVAPRFGPIQIEIASKSKVRQTVAFTALIGQDAPG